MTDTTTLLLIGLTGTLIVVLVILLIFFVRLYEKVHRLDTSDSHLHLLVGRIERINESVHKKIDQMHRDLTEYGENMMHLDRLIQAVQRARKQKESTGTDPFTTRRRKTSRKQKEQ
jgi:hypothetical protein|tara:strand:- start:426 stop:773 length:348 start_codon:yes stop_codon:yes gene_type:complete